MLSWHFLARGRRVPKPHLFVRSGVRGSVLSTGLSWGVCVACRARRKAETPKLRGPEVGWGCRWWACTCRFVWGRGHPQGTGAEDSRLELELVCFSRHLHLGKPGCWALGQMQDLPPALCLQPRAGQHGADLGRRKLLSPHPSPQGVIWGLSWRSPFRAWSLTCGSGSWASVSLGTLGPADLYPSPFPVGRHYP